MKKITARLIIILLLLNLSTYKISANANLFPNPTIENTTDSQATFKYSSQLQGTMYYVVTYKVDSAQPAESIKSNALSGTLTNEIMATGIISITAGNEGTFTVTGLSKKNYKLHTTVEINGVLSEVNTREFTALMFERLPEVVQKQTDKLIVKSKLNNPGVLYYGVYSNAEGVTAEEVVNDAQNPNKIYTNHQTVTHGVEMSISIDNLTSYQPYDIVFVKMDIFGNVDQTTETLNDVRSKGSRLIKAVMHKGDVSKIYLTFDENISNFGDRSNYIAKIFDDSGAPVYTLSENELSINSELSTEKTVVLNVLSDLSNYVEAEGFLEVTVLNGDSFNPKIEIDYNIALYYFDAHVKEINLDPIMTKANYYILSDPGPIGDCISVTLDRNLSTSPSAVNFIVSIEKTQGIKDFDLLPFVDFQIETKENLSGFDIIFTSAGALKLAPLATTSIKIEPNPESPPAFNPTTPSVLVVRNSSISTLSELGLYDQPIAGFSSDIYNYSVAVPYVLLQEQFAAVALRATPTSDESYVNIAIIEGNISKIRVIAADGTSSEYAITATPNELTLGGITIYNIPVSNFDPYASTFSYTIKKSMLPVPTMLVTHSPETSLVITSELSSNMANTYVYSIVLNQGDANAQFTIYVTCALGAGGADPVIPHGNSDNENHTDKSNIFVPTNEPNAGAISQTSAGLLPNEKINQSNLLSIMNNAKLALDKITTDQQAFSTLSQISEIVKQVTALINADPSQNTPLIQMVTDVVTKFEENINKINNPDNQLTALSQLMAETMLFKAEAGVAIPTLDKSIQDMVQKTANNFGTLKTKDPVGTQAVSIEQTELINLIDRQNEAIKKLNSLQQSYFETTVSRTIKKEIKIQSSITKELTTLKIELAPHQIRMLKEANVDSLSASNLSAEMKVPMLNLKPTDKVQLILETVKPSVSTILGNAEEPKLIYDIEFLINNEKQVTFDKPITITFDLGIFELEKESLLELAIFKHNKETNSWEPVGGIVDAEESKIYTMRYNLSQYTVLKSKKSFSDSDQSWAKAEINALLNKGIISESKNFEPQSILTRGEFAQWIAKAYGMKITTEKLPFKDVPKNSAAHDAIASAFEQGLLVGKSSTNFDPNAAVTQNELASALGKLLVNFYNNEKTDKITSKYLSQMKTTEVASWAESDMALLMELGLNITEKNGKDSITKEAAAAAFMKFYRS